MIKIIFGLLIILSTQHLQAADAQLVWENKKGNAFVSQWLRQYQEELEKLERGEIKKDDFKKPDLLPITRAYSQYIQALSRDSYNPLLHNNLAVSLELLEKYDDALKEYQIAFKYSRPDSLERLYVLINIARTYGKLKKIDLAVRSYQKALDLNAEFHKSKDTAKQIKTNIELLFKGGQGQGKGNNPKDKKDDKDKGKGKGDYKNKNKNQPQKFKSKKLSKEDVRRVLQELKEQEQKIRNKMNRKKTKERSRDKQW